MSVQMCTECTQCTESADAGTAMNDTTLEDDQQQVWRTVLSKKKHKQAVEDGGKPSEWSRVVRMEKKQPLSPPPSRETVHEQPMKQKILGTRSAQKCQ